MRALHVLIVDADGEFLEIVTRWLSRRGFLVMACTDVSDAISTAEREPLDVAVVARGLNDASNSRLLRQLRVLEPSLPLVILGEEAQETTGKGVRSPAMVEYVEKACSLRDLESSIRVVLNMATQQKTPEVADCIEAAARCPSST
jgi:DNA-binding response OmpR family regulator